jgi:anion-transporting  ArsA/GET3 family ATPase
MTLPFESQRIILVGGPGGVGKTTLAAAMALQYALAGYRTVVLTVDPARRLAQALGFDDFKRDLQTVPLPDGASGFLQASMLDSQRYFDRVIERFAKNQAQKERVLSNPLYRAMVDTMGGTHEYAAMERLFEFSQDKSFEKIIVDTPPTQNAIDLLSAPERMANFMDSSVLKWFRGSQPNYLSLFRHGTRIAMKMLNKIFGSEFLDELGRFIESFDGMQGGFQKRNREVIQLLQGEESAFLLVNYPSEARFLESTAFYKSLHEFQIPLNAVILNRVEPECPNTLPGIPADGETRRWLTYQHQLHSQQQGWVRRFQDTFHSLPVWQVQRLTTDLQDLKALSHLARFLIK